MAKTVSVIGIDPGELPWVRQLLYLLRHPDPLIAAMAKQAIRYLEKYSSEQAQAGALPIDHVG